MRYPGCCIKSVYKCTLTITVSLFKKIQKILLFILASRNLNVDITESGMGCSWQPCLDHSTPVICCSSISFGPGPFVGKFQNVSWIKKSENLQNNQEFQESCNPPLISRWCNMLVAFQEWMVDQIFYKPNNILLFYTPSRSTDLNLFGFIGGSYIKTSFKWSMRLRHCVYSGSVFQLPNTTCK